jgi:hypothetical protein
MRMWPSAGMGFSRAWEMGVEKLHFGNVAFGVRHLICVPLTSWSPFFLTQQIYWPCANQICETCVLKISSCIDRLIIACNIEERVNLANEGCPGRASRIRASEKMHRDAIVLNLLGALDLSSVAIGIRRAQSIAETSAFRMRMQFLLTRRFNLILNISRQKIDRSILPLR